MHHAGKDVTRGLRGSSALLGAADTVIVAKRSGDFVTLEMEKQKDAEEAQPLTLKTETINLTGSDDPLDLNPRVSSLVLVATDQIPAAQKPTDSLLDLIVELVETDPSEDRPTTKRIPQDKSILHRKKLFDEAWERGFSAANSKENADDGFRKKLKSLSEQKLIGIWNEYLWLT